MVRSGSTRAARHAVGRAGSKHTLQSRALLRLRIDRVSSLLFRLRERHRRRRAPVLGWARDREKASLALCAASRRFRRLSRRPNLGALSSLLFLGAGELVLPMLRRGKLEPNEIRRDSPAVSSSIFVLLLRKPAARPPPPVKQKSCAGGSFAERRATPSARLTSPPASQSPEVRNLRNLAATLRCSRST